MKRTNFFFFAAFAIILSLTSCMEYSYVEIPNDMYGIIVPVDGDTTQQAALQSFEEDNDKLVSGKKIAIPYKDFQISPVRKERKPAWNVYMVTRNPVSRQWTSTTEYTADGGYKYVKTGDMDGIATETKGSAGIMIGFNITYYVKNPFKFLWWQKQNADLKLFGDNTIRNSLAGITNEVIAGYDDDNLTINKTEIVSSIKARLDKMFQSEYGIAIKDLNMVGGIQFDSKSVQDQLDLSLKEKMARTASEDRLKTFQAKAALVEYEKIWLDIDMKRAIIDNINASSTKGFSIFPQVTGVASTLDVSKYMSTPVK